MLKKIKNELDVLQQSQDKQNLLLEQLYLTLQTINERKNYLYNPFTPKMNLFNYVRPEVMHQILGFVDLHSFLMLRLVNRQCNQISMILLKFKGIDLQNQANITELELDNLNKKLRICAEKTLDQIVPLAEQARYQLNQLTFASVVELRSFKKPTEICLKIAYFFILLLDPHVDERQNVWLLAQKALNQSNSLERLIAIQFETITESQLTKLSAIDEITQEQAAMVSHAAACIFSYVRNVVEIRKSELYIIKHKQYILEIEIKKQRALMQILQKILDK